MDKALLARVEQQAWFHRYPRGLPIFLLLIGLLVTVLLVINIERADGAARSAALAMDTEALASEIERKAGENLAYLTAAASLFSVSNEVSEEELSELVTDMSVGHNARGSLGLGWAKWIKASETAALEAMERDLHPEIDFRVRPQPNDPGQDMAIIAMLSPRTEANVRALGFDMYSEATRRTAMQTAMQTGEPAATGKVQLVQDAGSDPVAGALIYFPVYERIQLPNRTMRGRLKGFVYSPLRIPDLLQAALATDNQIARRVELYDGPPAPDNLMAATTTTNRDLISHSTPLEFAGRRWTLVVTSQTASGLTFASRTVLVLGTVISLLTMVVAWMATTRASDDRRVLEWLTRQSAIRTSLTRELNHRVKNTLANVLSIVALTRRRTSDLDEFADNLVGRIRALSATHDLLSQREWSNAPVLDVVTSELAPYLDPEDPHAEVSGPEAHLAPNDALSLGLALHELATNAAKYGALSVPEGRVSVTWTLPGPDRCEVLWQESGGPEVTVPTRRGFGLELIERIVSSELKSQVEIRFEPDGVTCKLQVPRRPEREFALRAPPAI